MAVVDEVGSVAGRSVTADLPTFLENVQQEAYEVQEIRESGEWSKVEILEKRLERIELDRLQDASDYAQSSDVRRLEEELRRVSPQLRRMAEQLIAVEIEKAKRAAAACAANSIEEAMESMEGRVARLEGELESLRSSASSSVSSCSCRHSSESVRERLLKRIPKFTGKAAAFPAFKQRFLAYKEQMKGEPSFAYYNDLCSKLEGEALEKVSEFAAQFENSFEAAIEKLSRHYGEYEPDEQLFTRIATIQEISSGSTNEMRDLEDYLRSAIGIYGRKLVRSLVIPIVVKFTEPLRKEWKDRIRPLVNEDDYKPEEELIKFLTRQRLNAEFVQGRTPRVGQEVLIKSEEGRASFEKGKVRELIKSTDGKVRNVEVKPPGDRCKRRALKELIPLN